MKFIDPGVQAEKLQVIRRAFFRGDVTSGCLPQEIDYVLSGPEGLDLKEWPEMDARCNYSIRAKELAAQWREDKQHAKNHVA